MAEGCWCIINAQHVTVAVSILCTCHGPTIIPYAGLSSTRRAQGPVVEAGTLSLWQALSCKRWLHASADPGRFSQKSSVTTIFQHLSPNIGPSSDIWSDSGHSGSCSPVGLSCHFPSCVRCLVFRIEKLLGMGVNERAVPCEQVSRLPEAYAWTMCVPYVS